MSIQNFSFPHRFAKQLVFALLSSSLVLAMTQCTCLVGQEIAAESKATPVTEIAEKESEAASTTPKAEGLPSGINDRFLDPNMDPAEFVQKFEIESREVFACRDAIFQSLKLEEGSEVADIGAGTGLFLQGMSKRVGSAGKVFAVELSPKFFDFLNERVKKEQLENVQVVRCTDRDVQLPPNSVDRVLICDVYHHFEYPMESLASIHKALRVGGKLILVDFYKQRDGLPEERAEWLQGHIRASEAVFRSEVEQSGFEFEEEVKVDGFHENYLFRFIKES